MANIFAHLLAKTINSITDPIPVPDEKGASLLNYLYREESPCENFGRQEYRPAELSPEEVENKQRLERFRELISIGKQMAKEDKTE